MRRLLSVFVVMLCLSLPAFGGHTMPGGWCECGSFAACICDPGEMPMGSRVSEPDGVPDKSKQSTPVEFGSEMLLVLAALLLVLRYKA